MKVVVAGRVSTSPDCDVPDCDVVDCEEDDEVVVV